MRSRIATVLSVLGLLMGGGGALAVAGGNSSSFHHSAAACQYGERDCDHGKFERHHRKLVRHCEKFHWRSDKCKAERREIRHCKERGGKHCLRFASPMRR